jgi:mRNA-degrading endonuclease RelE of RelBE toxin-antitoxin system
VAEYSIFIKTSATRELERLSKKDLTTLLERIEAPGENPGPAGSEKLDAVDLWRIRQCYYGIVYSIEDDVLTV